MALRIRKIRKIFDKKIDQIVEQNESYIVSRVSKPVFPKRIRRNSK